MQKKRIKTQQPLLLKKMKAVTPTSNIRTNELRIMPHLRLRTVVFYKCIVQY